MGEMKLLLDTHIFLWWISGDRRLSASAREILRDPRNERFLSSISVAEIALKTALGKLKLRDTAENTVRSGMSRLPALELPLRISHTLLLASLPLHHRDPFDRLLIAQAMSEGIPIMTRDPQMQLYGVTTIH